jgi:hypothetical protein
MNVLGRALDICSLHVGDLRKIRLRTTSTFDRIYTQFGINKQ